MHNLGTVLEASQWKLQCLLCYDWSHICDEGSNTRLLVVSLRIKKSSKPKRHQYKLKDMWIFIWL